MVAGSSEGLGRDDHEIGGFGSGQGDGVRVWGGVQDQELATVGFGHLLILGEPGGLGGDHHGQLLLVLASIAPTGGGGLGVEIDDDGIQAIGHGLNGEVNGEGGFPSSAFLADNSDRFHGVRAFSIGV